MVNRSDKHVSRVQHGIDAVCQNLNLPAVLVRPHIPQSDGDLSNVILHEAAHAERSILFPVQLPTSDNSEEVEALKVEENYFQGLADHWKYDTVRSERYTKLAESALEAAALL